MTRSTHPDEASARSRRKPSAITGADVFLLQGSFFPFADRGDAGYRDSIPTTEESHMKSIILWLCGVPIGVIILLKVFGVF